MHRMINEISEEISWLICHPLPVSWKKQRMAKCWGNVETDLIYGLEKSLLLLQVVGCWWSFYLSTFGMAIVLLMVVVERALDIRREETLKCRKIWKPTTRKRNLAKESLTVGFPDSQHLKCVMVIVIETQIPWVVRKLFTMDKSKML